MFPLLVLGTMLGLVVEAIVSTGEILEVIWSVLGRCGSAEALVMHGGGETRDRLVMGLE